MRRGLGTEGHGEEDSEGTRLVKASLLLGSKLCPLLLTGKPWTVGRWKRGDDKGIFKHRGAC